MEPETKITIHNLYKVFGPDPQRALKAVRKTASANPNCWNSTTTCSDCRTSMSM